MIDVYVIDGPKAGEWICTQYQDFRVSNFSKFDISDFYRMDISPLREMRYPEVYYRVHKWNNKLQYLVPRYGRGLEFQWEGYIASCNPFGPPDVLPQELFKQANSLDYFELFEYGCFEKDFDQWFVEQLWKTKMLTKEDLI